MASKLQTNPIDTIETYVKGLSSFITINTIVFFLLQCLPSN